MAAGNYTTTSHKPYEGEMLTDEQLAEYVAIAHMRNKFEQHFKLTLRQARRTKDGIGYQNPDIQARWEGWQAALAAVPVAQEPVATVLWHNGEKIIDGSMAFMDTAPIGTELYAAPVAAQEPIAWSTPNDWGHPPVTTYSKNVANSWKFDKRQVTPLYAQPAPAQEPTSHVHQWKAWPDDAGIVESCVCGFSRWK